MSEPKLVGGSEADRAEILRLHERYIDVNTRFDWKNLQPIFSGAPEATYYNLNGHTYNGREHWTRLWKFYGQNVSSTYWTPFDIGWRITEPALLSVKATRYPGQELRWDAGSFRFTNHEKANQEILSRNYREGFAPPQVS